MISSGRPVRHDQPVGEQLLSADERVAGRVVPDDPAAGDGLRAGVEPAGAAGRGCGCWSCVTVVPIACLSLSALMWQNACQRLLYPPDLGSEGKEVVDLETEAREAVGLYIKRDEFPDRLFAPPKRTSFLEEGVNPIYDKEMRSEIFSQGTLMLRLVIQISMVLALFVMAVLPVHLRRSMRPWYISYVLLFNMLVGPGVLGRQRHERARAANARPAAHDAGDAVADAVGQAALGACGCRAC